MTDQFLKWLAYNGQVDVLFTGLGFTAVVIVITGYIVWRTSIKFLRAFLKSILFLEMLGLSVAWYLDYWPWG